MDQNATDLSEAVNFIKDHLVGLEKKMDDEFSEMQEFRKEVKAEFTDLKNRIGGIDNCVDDELARRTDLESRVRIVLPNLPATPERV